MVLHFRVILHRNLTPCSFPIVRHSLPAHRPLIAHSLPDAIDLLGVGQCFAWHVTRPVVDVSKISSDLKEYALRLWELGWDQDIILKSLSISRASLY